MPSATDDADTSKPHVCGEETVSIATNQKEKIMSNINTNINNANNIEECAVTGVMKTSGPSAFACSWINSDVADFSEYVEIKARANAPFFIDYNDDTADFEDFIKAVASYVYDDCAEHATQLFEDAEANELASA